jgi:splicing factor 3B subunit 4
MATAGGRITAGVGMSLVGQHAAERNQEATVYAGNLDPQVSEEMVWELFLQVGPVVNVYLPKDRVAGVHQGYGFVEFRGEEDAEYAVKVLNMIKLFGKPLRVSKSAQDRKAVEVGANLFVGNLDPDIDEKLLYDTFSAFGVVVNTPKIMRDPDTVRMRGGERRKAHGAPRQPLGFARRERTRTHAHAQRGSALTRETSARAQLQGNSRGFGFVSFDSFEAADAAIDAMNGQFLCNRPVSVTCAHAPLPARAHAQMGC